MAFVKKDRVKETTTTTGTGSLTLAGAMTGFRAFSSVCSTNDTFWYALQAVDGSGNPSGDWEVGLGTYSGANTLARTTVYSSSNSGSAVNLSSGTKQVWIDLPAVKLIPVRGTFDTPPVDSQFSWVNQGSATTTTIDSGVTMLSPNSGGNSLRCRVMSAPSAPYQVVARIEGMPFLDTGVSFGLIWRDSASSKIQTVGIICNSGITSQVESWTNATTYSAGLSSVVTLRVFPPWIRLRDDNTNRYVDYSTDGNQWVQIFSFSRTSFMTPDQVGFYLNTGSSSFSGMVTVHHWYAGT